MRSPFAIPAARKLSASLIDGGIEIAIRQADTLKRNDQRLLIWKTSSGVSEVLPNRLSNQGNVGRSV